MTDAFLKSSSRWFWVYSLILFAILIRLFSLGLYPLMDTSEARYGEIVRLMVETNDWVIPYFDYGVPFLGKPPLFIWLSAVSFKIFGINEFAARLPSLICSLSTLALVWKLASYQMGQRQAKMSVLFLITSAMFLVLAGALLADPVMTLTITLILSGFWIGWHSQNESEALRWQYLFFVGCGLALLAKGLAALVLAGGPIFFWCLPKGRLITLWHRFPWVRGIALAAVIALPWYISAEMRSPGLLEYMFIGEHFSRYLDSGWLGDEYGNAPCSYIGCNLGLPAGRRFPLDTGFDRSGDRSTLEVLAKEIHHQTARMGLFPALLAALSALVFHLHQQSDLDLHTAGHACTGTHHRPPLWRKLVKSLCQTHSISGL